MFKLLPPEDDGLPIVTVGEWSRDKHHFLLRYIDAFTTSMKGKGWSGLHYIDLFAGAGIEILRDSGRLEWGSPLIAAQAPARFSGLHFCELDKEKCEALRVRTERLGASAQILNGDANEQVSTILKEIPPRSLSLAFLDPYGLHLQFDTLVALARRRADLIVFFPDHLDALRNCRYVYHDNPDSNLDQVLGPGVKWREFLDKSPRSKWAQVLRELYEKQIRGLGYRFFEFERISMHGRPLYLLVFCSRHQLAAKLWRGVSRRKPDDQRSFDFGQ